MSSGEPRRHSQQLPGISGSEAGLRTTRTVNRVNSLSAFKQTPSLQRRQQLCATAHATAKVPIMVNACTGKMGHATAEAVVNAGLTLVPYSFTGESEAVVVNNVGVSGIPVRLVGREQRQEAIETVRREFPDLVMIDFTLPEAVNENARFYGANRVPFVMGTTGGDRELLLADTLASGTYAVIAPQMGKQVVAFQAMLEFMADNFAGAFAGYKLEVVESHQRSKVDTSGTAKAVVSSFNKLGAPIKEADIVRIRDPSVQQDKLRIPDKYLTGHAYHTYRLTSADGTVSFEFQHNVRGRQIYAEGTVDAALFLAKKVGEQSEQKVFDMVDVLKEGNMR